MAPPPPLQKETIDFSTGSGSKLAKLPEAIEPVRQIYDAPKAGTARAPYRIVRRAEPQVSYDLADSNVGLDPSIPFGFEIWRQFHL